MINQIWIAKVKEEIEEVKTGTRKHIEMTLSYAPAKKFLICRFVEAGLPFRVHNLGCGVCKITTQTDICPKCHGTGKC